jgi:hypothetical protein
MERASTLKMYGGTHLYDKRELMRYGLFLAVVQQVSSIAREIDSQELFLLLKRIERCDIRLFANTALELTAHPLHCSL